LDYVAEMQNRFYGLTITDLRTFTFQLAERNGIQNPFTKNLKMAGNDWAASFMKIIQKRTAYSLSIVV